ncbi:MAG: GIY-YIG nuclease family protein [Bdellovibrionales bacterium]|nr:GIY-YIG nuclease family protein [Bdellovibrionales bacterium]
MKKLFSRKIEKVSRKIFEKYQKALSKLIGTSQGVYALYNNNELYYVGKASNLKRRVRQHLKDRHALWTSLFIIFNQ